MLRQNTDKKLIYKVLAVRRNDLLLDINPILLFTIACLWRKGKFRDPQANTIFDDTSLLIFIQIYYRNSNLNIIRIASSAAVLPSECRTKKLPTP